VSMHAPASAVNASLRLPAPLPHGMAFLRHPPGVGSRIVFSLTDLPLPPDIARATFPGAWPGGHEVTVPVPPAPGSSSSGHATLHTGLRRICGRRVVALGQKPFLIGGAAEGNAYREFVYEEVRVQGYLWSAYKGLVRATPIDSSSVFELPDVQCYVARPSLLQLKVPRPEPFEWAFAPRRITLLDRGPWSHAPDGSGFKMRSFANVPGMLAVMRKYDLEVDVVTDVRGEGMAGKGGHGRGA
jgi:hypothetical protein